MDCSDIVRFDRVCYTVVSDTVPMQPYQIQLYSFRVQDKHFSYLGSPTIVYRLVNRTTPLRTTAFIGSHSEKKKKSLQFFTCNNNTFIIRQVASPDTD